MYLLDVNMLIALCDSLHAHHLAATRWFQKESKAGWATCPITENGFVRIMGREAYPNGPQTTAGALRILRQFRTLPGHQFWKDRISISDEKLFGGMNKVGSKQITDVYLVVLAASYGGRLVTLDKKMGSVINDSVKNALFIVR